MDLSIIILNYNTKKYLKNLLDSLAQADFANISYEIIVVDNGSSDGSQELIKKEYKNVKLVKNGQNFGFSRANNIGARFAKGKYLLFLNSDTLVEKNSIKDLFLHIKNSDYVGGTARLELENGKLDPACHRGFPTPWNAFFYFTGIEKILGKIKFFGGYHQGWKNLKEAHQVDCISGACFLIKKDIFKKLNGWDESYFIYGEDVDLSYRLKNFNYKLVFYPKAKIVHFKKKSGREKTLNKKIDQKNNILKKKTKEQFFYTMRIFYEKHYKSKYPKLVYKLVLFGIKIISKIKN